LSRSKTIPAVAGMIAALASVHAPTRSSSFARSSYSMVESMSRALAEACKALRLSEREDPAMRLLAMRIIERARGGARDVGQLKDAALKDFPH
jgi:hypothetical protein